ncbi:MAG TPA: AAA family ATPase [Candidatus Lustribacter sp.]|nr:AAA family ATPase [Candidatus Lustribacter sp.]
MHVHSGVPHVHATVDHLSGTASLGSRQTVQLDGALMQQLGLHAGDTVRVATERGRSSVARLDAPAGDNHAGTVRLDRFLRQALKARLNETVEIEPLELAPARRVELLPAVDVSTAHDLIPHLRAVLAADRTPVSRDAVLYLPFPGTTSGTTYLVASVDDGPGFVTPDTEITLQYADAHVPDGAMDVTFEDVGGLGAQIRSVRELVQLPLKFPHVYQQLGITAPRGIILYGPPGAGKTRMARAIANEVEARFYYINGPDIIGTYAGETEGNLRRIFGEAGHHAPSIIFIDELDAIAPKRGETGAHADIRVVTQLLSLMDGLTRVDSVVVVATTNRLDAVDPAFRRPGRFDREIFVGPPDAAGRRDVLDIHTREMPLTPDALAGLDDIAYRTHGFVGADLMELCREAGLSALRRNTSMLADHRAAFRLHTDQIVVARSDFEHALAHVRPSALRETLISRPDVTWADVGGLDELREELRELVEMPLQRPDVLAAMNLADHSGVLLYGPPGTGKTLLAQAVANECGVNFIAVNGPELFTKWLGESEEAVRHIFRIARQVAPAVIFFDQLDSITPIRGEHTGSMTTERVVNQLLAELDGIEPLAGIVVLGATNRIDLVDPAILRPGRLGTHVHVPLPDGSARRAILALFLRGQDAAASIEALLAPTEGFSGAQLRELCSRAKRLALRRTGYAGAVEPSTADLLGAVDTVRRES